MGRPLADSPPVPLYQSETAPRWIRGSIVSCYAVSITIGLLLASVVNNATQDREDTGSYRIPIAVQFAWAIILSTGMLLLPDTPRYMVKKGDSTGAAMTLSRLRRLPPDDPAIMDELAEIQANHKYELKLGESTYADCFKGNHLKRLATGCGLQALQQLTGINFVFYYGTQFFKNSGFHNSFTIIMIISSVNVCSTLFGVWAIERWGRRPVLLWGAIGMCISQFLVAILGVTTTGQDAMGNIIVHNEPAQKATVAFVCLYISSFTSSWGPVSWLAYSPIRILPMVSFPFSFLTRFLSLPSIFVRKFSRRLKLLFILVNDESRLTGC
jgi:MFS transporter, SP family, sugar:H+ symporter